MPTLAWRGTLCARGCTAAGRGAWSLPFCQTQDKQVLYRRPAHLEAAGVSLVLLLEGLCVPLLGSHILLQTVCPIQGILPQLLGLLAKEVGRCLQGSQPGSALLYTTRFCWATPRHVHVPDTTVLCSHHCCSHHAPVLRFTPRRVTACRCWDASSSQCVTASIMFRPEHRR